MGGGGVTWRGVDATRIAVHARNFRNHAKRSLDLLGPAWLIRHSQIKHQWQPKYNYKHTWKKSDGTHYWEQCRTEIYDSLAYYSLWWQVECMWKNWLYCCNNHLGMDCISVHALRAGITADMHVILEDLCQWRPRQFTSDDRQIFISFALNHQHSEWALGWKS